MPLEGLLRKAAGEGGRELHLALGRTMTIVTADGERELQGREVTWQLIHQVIAPVVPASAREALANGRAEWTVRHSELGSIRVVAEQRNGTESGASFFLPMAVDASPRLSLVITAPNPAAEMDALLEQMVKMEASDLHISAGSATS